MYLNVCIRTHRSTENAGANSRGEQKQKVIECCLRGMERSGSLVESLRVSANRS